MRVLHISPYPPERDGIGAYCARICGELARQGHAVAVVSARPSGTSPPEVIGSLRGWRRDGGFRLKQAIDDFDPDVVHLEFAVAAYGSRIRELLRLLDEQRSTGRPVAITMHEVTRDCASLRAVGRALYRRVTCRADRVIVHTNGAREELLRVAGPDTRVSVIRHHSVMVPNHASSPEHLRRRHGLGADRIVLAFGFIDVNKGLGDLIEAARRLQEPGSLAGVRIVIAGAVRRRFGVFRVFELRDRHHLRALRRAVCRGGLRGRVTFTGYVPDDEVRGWLDAAELVVLPYRRCEQSGVAHLARAAGTAMLTSDAGELDELTPIAPFRAGDGAALAGRLERLLTTSRPASPPRGTTRSDLAERVREIVVVYRQLASPAPSTRIRELAWTRS